MTALLSLALLLQVGNDIHSYPQADLPVITQRRHEHGTENNKPASDALVDCLNRARADSASALLFARDWLSRSTTPASRVWPDQCLGMILSDQGDYTGAQAAFADGVAGLAPDQATEGVPLMAMAGNAALAAGNADGALTWFNRAYAIKAYEDRPARGALAADRARALVALGRIGEASDALAEAREQAPNDATVFLLSATLARRAKDLTAAQRYIETAAGLSRSDPAIGLEAGVIAVLSGHDDAARKSWQSVIATAPDGPEAQAARDYLKQLGDEPSAPLDHAPSRATLGPNP
jgi:tetratricopeptide (TPR) repeat protein